MVTVELAVGFLTVALVATVLAGLLLVGVMQARCDYASTELARQYARGDQQAAERVRSEAPARARISVERTPDGVEVEVSAPVTVVGVGDVVVSGHAWSRWEPGVAP